jgi:imidazolonepropionase-like amidohydrolase
MNKNQPIVCTLILFALFQNVRAQQFSKRVSDYIGIQDSVIVLKNTLLVDGTGGALRPHQDIVLRNGRITAIGTTGEQELPAEATIIDATGKTVLPGFVMLHEHLFYAKPFDNNFKAVHMTHTFPKMYLAGGVTTMRTAGSIEANSDLNVKNAIDAGKVLGPSIDVSTPHVEREGFILQIQSLYGDEDIEKWLDYWFVKGVTSVKVYNNITKADLKKIIAVAHVQNIKVTGHLCSITYREAAELGIDNLEHSFMASTDFVDDKPENECVNGGRSLLELDDNDPALLDLMKFLIEKKVTLTYTPNPFEPFTDREVVPGGAAEALAPYLRDQMQTIYDQNIATKDDSLRTRAFRKEMKRVLKFHELGGKITVGTDPTGSGKTIAGYANRHLIEMLIETGFPLEEAIRLATRNGAEYLGIDDETGTVAVGKKADLILIDGDLTQDISNIRKTQLVFKNGVGFDSKKIFESVKGKIGLD